MIRNWLLLRALPLTPADGFLGARWHGLGEENVQFGDN